MYADNDKYTHTIVGKALMWRDIRSVESIVCYIEATAEDEHLFETIHTNPDFRFIRTDISQEKHHWFIARDPNDILSDNEFYEVPICRELIEHYNAYDNDGSARVWLWDIDKWSARNDFPFRKVGYLGEEKLFWDLEHLEQETSGKLPSLEQFFEALKHNPFIRMHPDRAILMDDIALIIRNSRFF